MKKYTCEDCIALLQSKSRELAAGGLNRYPQRSDFEIDETAAIKSFFGPWPRALEAAGLKPVNGELAEKKRLKRVSALKKKRQRKLDGSSK